MALPDMPAEGGDSHQSMKPAPRIAAAGDQTQEAQAGDGLCHENRKDRSFFSLGCRSCILEVAPNEHPVTKSTGGIGAGVHAVFWLRTHLL